MADVGQGNEIAEAAGRVVANAFLKYRISVLEDVLKLSDTLPEWTHRDRDKNVREAIRQMMHETERAIAETSEP